jgi:hypothetical protein
MNHPAFPRFIDHWHSIRGTALVSLGLVALTAPTIGQTLFSQDFEGLTLGPNVDETLVAGTNVWTKTPPTGWTIDDTGMAALGNPNEGVTEWIGWSFANKDWWVAVAENQRRGDFTRGTGTVAIADPDEWDDKGNPEGIGTFNSFLKTPAIDITHIRPNSLELSFDSSFRPEGNQKASVTVSYNGAAPVTVFEWVATDDNKTNERVTYPLNNPAGATSMVVTWGMTNAVNNWFWAIDNIKIDRVGPLFAEDFNGLTLQDAIDEPVGGTSVWTNIPPEGWAIDNSEMFKGFWDPDPPPDDFREWPGRSEWTGWAFATIEWWPTVDNQRRSEFTKATGNVAIADPDEWDDQDGPVNQGGKFNSFLNTPKISLAGVPANTVLLKFDSCWRPECCDDGDFTNNQTATVEVSFDGGPKIKVVDWSSNNADPNYKDDNSTNDTILVPVPNPAGAKTMELSFGLTNAANDWFWAVDNISLTAGTASLASVTPSPNQVIFDIADTGANKINTTTIVLKINDVVVPTVVTPAGTIIRVTYSPAVHFPPTTTFNYVLSANDTAGMAISFSGSFTTLTPFLPLNPLPGPDGSEGQFGVRYLWGASAAISGIARAVEAITSTYEEGEFDGLIFDTTHPFINHGDGAGFIPDDQPYPDDVLFAERWTDDDFIQLAKGRIRITEPGEYTFGIHSDDGFGFRIFGATFSAVYGAGIIDPGAYNSVGHPGDTGDSNTRAVTTLQPGDYDIEFFWWERGGGDFGELYAAKGNFAADADTDTWRLVGGEEGLPLVGPPTASAIRITEVTKLTDPASVRLTFTVNPGESYIAQYSLDLKAPWTNIGTPVTPAAGAATATLTVPLNNPPLSTAGQVHFRVQEQP